MSFQLLEKNFVNSHSIFQMGTKTLEQVLISICIVLLYCKGKGPLSSYIQCYKELSEASKVNKSITLLINIQAGVFFGGGWSLNFRISILWLLQMSCIFKNNFYRDFIVSLWCNIVGLFLYILHTTLGCYKSFYESRVT